MLMFTFPHTPYLYSEIVREDKVLNERERNNFLDKRITIEEKVDGYNLGISFDKEANLLLQHRGSYVDDPKIYEWLKPRIEMIFDSISDRYIIFGEWCYYKHSIHYIYLPSYFLGFDVYDNLLHKFLSVADRDWILEKANLFHISLIGVGTFTLEELQQIIVENSSAYAPGRIEGVYLKYDDDIWTRDRAKLVDSGFTQSIDTHWSKGPLIRNEVIY